MLTRNAKNNTFAAIQSVVACDYKFLWVALGCSGSRNFSFGKGLIPTWNCGKLPIPTSCGAGTWGLALWS